MRKKIIGSVFALICFCFITYTAIISTEQNNDTAEISPSQHKNTGDTDITPADTDILQHSRETSLAEIKEYKIQSSDNRLNIYQIYSNGYKELIQSVEFNTNVLPEKDRIQLQEGISSESYKDVCSMIEDFSS